MSDGWEHMRAYRRSIGAPVTTDYLVRRISANETYEDLLNFPRYFEIETVNACQARCPMCTIDDWDRRDGLMPDELFRKIAYEIGLHPEVKRVHLYRDGEPLLDKKLPERVKMLKGVGVKEVGISTNVELLTHEKTAALLDAGLDSIILSIDSLKKEVYEKIRVGLDFGTVMDNAYNFVVMRNAKRSPCQVWVRMIRQESNYDEWPTYERHWKALLKDSDRVDFRDLHHWGNQLISFDRSPVKSDTKPCIALWSLMVIFANGDVPRCNVDYNLKHPVGNLKDSTIEELWKSQVQKQVREKHLSGLRDSICVGCDVWTERVDTAKSGSIMNQ